MQDRWFPTPIHWKTKAIEQRNKDERSSLESMEGLRQLTVQTIRRIFMKVKLNCKGNQHMTQENLVCTEPSA